MDLLTAIIGVTDKAKTLIEHPQKINVWIGIIYQHIIEPFFIEGNLRTIFKPSPDRYRSSSKDICTLTQNNEVDDTMKSFDSSKMMFHHILVCHIYNYLYQV